MTGSDDVRAPNRWSVRSVPDRIWVPALVGLLLAVGFVSALLVRADGDVSLLVHAAPPWTEEADGARGSLTVQPDVEDGFDGQFFYRIGVAPWSTERTVGGVTFDLPSLRNARWGYGALAYAASAGDPDLVPWALVGLNVAAAAAVGAIGGGLARTSGRHAAWGVLFVLWPGFAYSLSLDTSELVASAFLLGGLLALRRRRWVPGALLFCAAVLTRDTTAVVPFGVAIAGAWLWWSAGRSATRTSALGGSPADGGDASIGSEPETATTDRVGASASGLILAGGLPLVTFGAWQLWQRSRFGSLPLTSSGDSNLSFPMAGLVDQLAASLPPSGADEGFRLASMAGLVLLVGSAAWCWRGSTARLEERGAWVPAMLVVVILNAYLWSGATAFMRAATEAGLLSTLILLGSSRRRLLRLAGLGLAGLWALTAVAQLSKLP